LCIAQSRSSPAVCSTEGGQELLAGFSADETGGGDDPRITSSCHCSSKVSEPGRLVFSACRAEGYGFATVDSVRGSGTAAPGKCRRCSVPDWPPTRRGPAPTLPQRGPCGCAASPTPVFSAPARGTRSRVLLLERGRSSLQEALPLYTHNRPRKRRGR
jgi:hypothetical protein